MFTNVQLLDWCVSLHIARANHRRCAYLNKMLIFSLHIPFASALNAAIWFASVRLVTETNEHAWWTRGLLALWPINRIIITAVKLFSRCFRIKFRGWNSVRECRTYRLEYYRKPSQIVCQSVRAAIHSFAARTRHLCGGIYGRTPPLR